MNKALLLALLVFLLAGCGMPAKPISTEKSELITPTMNKLFVGNQVGSNADIRSDNPAGAPTISAFFGLQPTPGSLPAFTPSPSPKPEISTPVPLPTQEILTRVWIYKDSLIPEWNLQQNSWIKIDSESSDYVHSGLKAISITPTKGMIPLLFTVNQDGGAVYPRNQVEAVSFWLNSGDDYLDLDDLSVTVVGSNQNPYWSQGDHSVESSSDPVFSETRLYFLDLNRSIPPDTWVEVEVVLNSLIYDPDYKYVTGIYIKNDEDFLRTFYIDDLSLLVKSSLDAAADDGTSVEPPGAAKTPAPFVKTEAVDKFIKEPTPGPSGGYRQPRRK